MTEQETIAYEIEMSLHGRLSERDLINFIESILSIIKETREKAKQEERDRIITGLLKEYKGQTSQVEDAITFINQLTII